MEKDYLVAHLGEMLGFGRLSSNDSSMLPMLLLQSGDQRVALLVDSIEGDREVVIKAIGPQLGGIRWLAGATILGDGRVVLILDALTLLRSAGSQESIAADFVQAVEDKPLLKTIMVVDDSITVRKVTARLLKRQGMEVLTAKDGLDAVAQLQDHIPDLMLLDVEMPRMDGFELAQRMRGNDDWKHIPIIMITSRTGVKHRERAAKIGIDKHLGKPFNETELLEHIHNLLDRPAEEQRESA
ncbi:MAG: response regulator [Pseudomonadota bacterium]